MRISPTGNVGIGTIDPLIKLHVVGNSFTTQNIGLGSKLYFNNENLATPTVYIHKLNSSEPNIESYGAFNIRNPSETTTTHNLRIFDRPNDTTPSFAINKSGVLLLGSGGTSSPDVRISRGGPNWVRFQNTMLTISRDVNEPISSPGLRFSRQDLHSTSNPYANFEIMMSGKLRWGDALSVPDLSLERNPDGFLKLEGVKYDGATGVRYLTYDTTDKLIKMTSIPPTSPRWEIIDSESREMIDSLNTKITSLEDKIRDLELKIERLIDRQNP
ncbi:hypothetical protein [Faecalibacter bovis]|uniref:Peptidase S74 domain-containing protein n=1 Tax=Faecalibacter bovis TaxID=2898187 RepID=A0ABX7XB42_9FLAO|nr:hypothetical protein [Faecalibacter bovis]QTV05019.1 hypothetical protein J9309_09485 [Faecalibacter bovis]